MTIENHIEVLKSYHNGFTGCVGNLQDSIDVAVDIMEKYQQIEEIVKQYKKFGNIDFSMQIICGVVGDGADN